MSGRPGSPVEFAQRATQAKQLRDAEVEAARLKYEATLQRLHEERAYSPPESPRADATSYFAAQLRKAVQVEVKQVIEEVVERLSRTDTERVTKKAGNQLSPRTISRLEEEYRKGLQESVENIEDIASGAGLVVQHGYVNANGCLQPLTQGKPVLTNVDDSGALSELQPVKTPGQRALAADEYEAAARDYDFSPDPQLCAEGASGEGGNAGA